MAKLITSALILRILSTWYYCIFIPHSSISSSELPQRPVGFILDNVYGIIRKTELLTWEKHLFVYRYRWALWRNNRLIWKWTISLMLSQVHPALDHTLPKCEYEQRINP